MTEKFALVDGYRSYFSYSKTRAGYSGTYVFPLKDGSMFFEFAFEGFFFHSTLN